MFKFDGSQLTALVKQATEKLGEAAGESALRAAGVAGANVFREEAKRNLIANGSVDSGTILRNIIMKRREEDSNGNLRQSYVVTVRQGKFNADGDAFYWRFVEDGHLIVKARMGKAKVSIARRRKLAAMFAEAEFGNSRVEAKPFMRPAYDSKREEVVGVITKTLAAEIKKNLGGA